VAAIQSARAFEIVISALSEAALTAASYSALASDPLMTSSVTQDDNRAAVADERPLVGGKYANISASWRDLDAGHFSTDIPAVRDESDLVAYHYRLAVGYHLDFLPLPSGFSLQEKLTTRKLTREEFQVTIWLQK
jgi:hypothetical protein